MVEEATPERPERELTRRSFLKGIGKVGVAAAGGLLVTKEAVNLSKEEIKTKEGIFVPLYETHYTGIKEKHVPSDTDIFFVEGIEFLRGPEDLLSSPMQRKYLIAPELLVKLAKQETEIMAGDILPPALSERSWIKMGEVLAGGGAIMYPVVKKVMKGGASERPKGASRREFLKKGALIGGSLWALSPTILQLLPIAAASGTENMAARRIAARLYAMSANLHPEDTRAFFKSLVIAEKLLVAADEFKQKVGRKPKISFNVGAGHGNIEDFLWVGQAVCRDLIFIYPNPVLEEAIKLNGGIENFSRITFYKLPPNLGNNLSLDQLQREVIDKSKTRYIIDQRLASGLHERLKM